MRTRPQVTTGHCDLCGDDDVPVARLVGPREVTTACSPCLELAVDTLCAREPKDDEG